MKKILLVFVLQFIVALSFAQFKIEGTVRTADGRALQSANIFLEKSKKGTSSGSDGKFEITDIKPGSYRLMASFVGYKPYQSEVEVKQNVWQDIVLVPEQLTTDDIVIMATRAGEKTPVAHSSISKEEIEEQNLGQDIPYLLSHTPSVVTSSDAGAGIGYTSISVRGSDSKRINVTIDGIPLNDPESHSVYWVNLPDLASSINNIQIQRGVGTSTNGAAAFGATMDFQTQSQGDKPYAKSDVSFGSFNSLRNNIEVGTGQISDKFLVETRLSQISSDGFVDRATSDLKSFYVSGAYEGQKTSIKASLYSGKEKTYQAWNGVPKVRLENDTAGMQRYLDHWLYDQEEYDNMIASDSRTYNFYTYKNEVDNYEQNHVHLFVDHKFNSNWQANLAFHYTKGKGYYENYKKDRHFADYQLDNPIIAGDTIRSTDLIQQKWLDNDFYGLTFSTQYSKGKSNIIIGGAASQYIGEHFGKVIWSEFSGSGEKDHQWYFNKGKKTDGNLFAKLTYQILPNLSLFEDIQIRHIDYSVDGLHDDLRDISMEKTYTFFNPKFGLFFEPTKRSELFASVAVAHREPSRRNYVDDTEGKVPTPEKLTDYEIGGKLKFLYAQLGANLYFMDYRDQLVLTGKINNVGDAILTNVAESYRAGIELMAGLQLSPSFNWSANFTFSQNKIADFTEYVDNWDAGAQLSSKLGETDIAFSPDIIFSNMFSLAPFDNFKIALVSKYVGMQYIDNTSNNDRALDPYMVHNLRLNYSIKEKLFSEISFHLMINNLFNEEYETWAWVYRYISAGEEYAMDGYFPQAGRNFMAGLSLKF
ncbi:MAG: TonB-dependent receptor [Bacteroidales bacterium]|nr:TonB-dependent receptor [Bacteroidales bacterium]MCF8458271.1 TonB-dependent receptor [Bacteroidales bacterium]